MHMDFPNSLVVEEAVVVVQREEYSKQVILYEAVLMGIFI